MTISFASAKSSHGRIFVCGRIANQRSTRLFSNAHVFSFSLQIRLSIVAVLFVMVSVSHVNSAPEHCTTHSIKDFAVDACSHIVGRKFKRQIDLSDFGYNIESVTGEKFAIETVMQFLKILDSVHQNYFLIFCYTTFTFTRLRWLTRKAESISSYYSKNYFQSLVDDANAYNKVH